MTTTQEIVQQIRFKLETMGHMAGEIHGLLIQLEAQAVPPITSTIPTPPIADTLAGTSANTTDPVPVPDPIVVPPTSETTELPDTE